MSAMDNTPAGLQLETVTTLEKVTAEEWDALAEPEGFYMSHGWLRSVERESGASVTYLLVYAGDRLVGGLPLYEVEREHNKFYALRPRLELMGAGGDWGVAGSHRGYSCGIPRAAEHEEAVLDLLLAARRELSPPARAGSLFLFATNRTAAALHRRGAAVDFDCGDASLYTGGKSFPEYCARLDSRHRRSRLQREYARFLAAGYELGRQRLSECLDEVAPLLANLQAKYGHSTSAEEIHHEFADQATCLDDRSVVFTARCGGRLIGAAVMYEWRGTLYARAAGFDYGALRDAYEYYGLCYYLPIDYMSEHGLTALHLGIGAYGAKVKRGARLVPLWTVALPDDPADTPRFTPPDLTHWQMDHGPAAAAEDWRHPWTAR
ncbi:GNAT family N-acetyltransferase [Streptomyces caelestis]|uniref:Putative N-acyltransferase n=1 Tax=Streptomyces caelestis TaxID=36816 RepID=A0A7W9H055_9ACTN|nr:GNAT family N-acetyltransferase [Streptomyces caelestis]MBB5792924.1 putative N-acyltransferase [Streptomyces caelestis]